MNLILCRVADCPYCLAEPVPADSDFEASMIHAAGSTFDAPLTACPICSSAQIADYDRDFNGIGISRCQSCELLFMNPQYSDEHLADYYANYEPNDPAKDPMIAARRRVSKTDNLAWIEQGVAPGRLLSIGCGDGLELEIAKSRGWQAEGFDVNEESARRAAQRTGVQVRHGDFFQLEWPVDAYDCVYMDQVIEHPKNPQDYLRSAVRLLRPGGVLFLGCPNIASISSAFKGWLGRAGLRAKRRGRHYDTSHHLFYFSPRVLGRLLVEQFGFEAVQVEGDALNGRKPFVPGSNWRDRLTLNLRRRFPVLESTMRIVARKPVAVSSSAAGGPSSKSLVR